jgi:prepilin signal peptidase PulO-like enzyme (type II secretory pathway)
VELFTGIVFAISAWQLGVMSFFENPLILVSNLLLMTTVLLFVLVIVWDLKYMIIPNELVIIGFVVTILIFVMRSFIDPCVSFDWNCFWVEGLLGAIIMSGFFWSLYTISRGKWIGGGDVKIAIWLGLLIGWKMVYPALMIAYVIGAIIAIFLVVKGKKGMKSQLPFGPFLILGAYVVVFFQDQIQEIISIFFR